MAELWAAPACSPTSPGRRPTRSLTRDEQVTIAVQVNGKLRGTLDIARDTRRAGVESAALDLPQVLRWLEGQPPRKVIVVPNRIVNIVA